MIGRRLQTLEEAVCFISAAGLQINLDKLFKVNRSGSFSNVGSEPAAVKTLSRHLSTGVVYKLAAFIGGRQKKYVIGFRMAT